MPDLTPTNIHPTAVVEPGAQLADGVTVGPFALIESGAVVGAGVRILAHAVITRWATLGAGCEVHFGAILGHEPQDLTFRGAPSRVRIGERTVIREYATIHRATVEGGETVLGDDCLVMANGHIAHDCQVGNRVILCNSALLAGHVRIGDRAFISGNAAIHQFCRIGRLAMVSGLAGIPQDVGPFLTVSGRGDLVGLNTVGMRRSGLDGGTRAAIKLAYRELFGAPRLEEGLARLETMLDRPEVREIATFYRSSRRGFARPPPRVLGASSTPE